MSIPPYVDTDFYVKVTEGSMSDTILPSVLVGDFQESAENGVVIYGVDTPSLNSKGYCWIILRMSVELEKSPKWKDNFKIRTWSCGSKSIFWRRDYLVIDGEDKVIGRSTSEWIVADIDSHRPIRPTKMVDDFSEFPDYKELLNPQNNDFSLQYSSPKLDFPLSVEELGEPSIVKYADYSELDHNHHVNNTRYIAWAYDALFKSGIDVDSISKFDINYHSEVKPGEKVDIYLKDENGYHYLYGYKNGDEKVFNFRCI